ncbi:MAG TPA: O-antigen ligase family protein [Candidatus Hydrogenedentes bacterium]|nr:O-antigen ligase family protein [Candidatus Hydrogenedentota bacterium]HPG66005.1 O-antigen ligase family protein [Candidatus Hydrogenedentota bacterium]
MTDQAKSATVTRSTLVWVAVVLFVGVTLFIGEAALAAGAGLILAVAFAPAAPWLLIGFLAVLLGFCVPMSETPVPVAGMRFYGADVLLYFLALAALFLVREVAAGRRVVAGRPQGEKVLLFLLGTMFCYGFVSLFVGVSHDYAINDALGTFRRLYFYALSVVLALVLPLQERHLRRLEYAFWGACGFVVLIGLYRSATGKTWLEDYFTKPTGYITQKRLLSHTEIASLGMALGYFMAKLRTKPSVLVRLIGIAASGAAVLFLLLSGWRLALGYIVIAPVLALCLMAWLRRQRVMSVLWAAVLIGGFVIAGGAAMAFLAFPEKAIETLQLTQMRITEWHFDEDLRYYAWKEVLDLTRSHPILGVGLGHQLVIFIRSSDGAFRGVPTTSHNTYLDVLYQSGVIGFALFVVFHLIFLVYLVRHIRRVKPEYHAVLTGLVCAYLCVMTVIAMQPLQPAGVVGLHIMMGFILLLLRPEHAMVPEARAPAVVGQAEGQS